MKSNVLILGGAGFIGSNIAEWYVNAGWNVTVVDGLLEQTGGRIENIWNILHDIHFIQSRIEAYEPLHDLVHNNALIIDCMAWTAHNSALENPLYDIELNILSHLPLLDAVKDKSGIKIVFLGSRGQYGSPRVETITEDTPMVPEDIQGIDKVAAESYFRIYSKLYNIPVMSLRIGNCYGENQPVNGPDIGLVGTFIRSILDGKTIDIYDTARKRPVIYVKDLAEIVFRLGAVPLQGFHALNVCCWNIPIEDIMKTITETVGYGTYRKVDMPIHVRKTDIGYADFDCSVLKGMLGEIPVTPLGDSFRSTVDYFISQTVSG
ncbi:NAD(P)-dependent oxidoreductase [bacterium]|nr:NAD(P)-dependent oxidoreductase [bacterium]